jgi:hypothetical protein
VATQAKSPSPVATANAEVAQAALVGDEAAMVLELAAHVGIPLPRLDGSYRVEDLFCGARLDGGRGAL